MARDDHAVSSSGVIIHDIEVNAAWWIHHVIDMNETAHFCSYLDDRTLLKEAALRIYYAMWVDSVVKHSIVSL